MKDLPNPVTTTNPFTFTFPNLLLGLGLDANGFVVRQVREGERRQVDYTTTTSFVREPVEEKPFAFARKSKINIGGSTIEVLNEAVNWNGKHLEPSVPGLNEYLALIGKPVLVAFRCDRDLSKSNEEDGPVYRIIRSTITLL